MITPLTKLALLALSAVDSPEVSAIAHRGYMQMAPENTIAAFDAAAKARAAFVEVDVRQTRDGALILMHDATVDRTTNGKGPVGGMTLSEIQGLDAGGGQRVPLLRDALLWAKRTGVRIDIDHKSGDVDSIARAIREADATADVVIEGPFDRLRRFVELLPGVDTMPKVRNAGEIASVCAALHTKVVRLSLDQLRDPTAVAEVRRCGAKVSVTVLGASDNEQGIAEVIALGANLIETDHPGLVVRLSAAKPLVRR